MNNKVRVLIVDDDADYADTLKLGLERYGFKVVIESNHAEASAHLTKHTQIPYDVILIDVRLIDDKDAGDISGITLAKDIKASIPKIILSQHDTLEYVRQALATNPEGKSAAFTYVSKSEGHPAIVNAIRQVIKIQDLLQTKVSELDARLKSNYQDVARQSGQTFLDSRIFAYTGIRSSMTKNRER